jgi:hypothetical protein
LADNPRMKPIFVFLLLITSLLFNTQCLGGKLALTTGYQKAEHQYLDDTSHQEGQIFGASLDFQHWRRKNTGWLARGPSFNINQAANFISVNAQLPLYQWHKHQGSWLSIDWQQQDLHTQLTDSRIFLGNNGTSTSLPQDSTISSTREFQRIQFYWHESTHHESTINVVGVSYSREFSPVSSELSSTNASLFDGKFTGLGITLGRIKDDRGLNFQWRLHVASLDSDFSDTVTQHRALAKKESAAYKVALHLSWHYRYYLAPYWYLVPQMQYNVSYLAQSELAPINVEHPSFVYTQSQSTISLRHHF